MPAPPEGRRFGRLALLLCVLATLSEIPAGAQIMNGFDLSSSVVNVAEIRRGGPGRDSIRALTDPVRVSADDADRWMRADDRVIGAVIDGRAVAWPISILNWHEIINDVVADTPVVATWCPLTASSVVFRAGTATERTILGVSGLLYKSNVLLFDRASAGLHAKLLMKGISGESAGALLEVIPSVLTSWESWRAAHPETEVTSRAIPSGLDYGTDPYRIYARSGPPMFPVRGSDNSQRAKERAFLIVGARERFIVRADLLAEVNPAAPIATVADAAEADGSSATVLTWIRPEPDALHRSRDLESQASGAHHRNPPGRASKTPSDEVTRPAGRRLSLFIPVTSVRSDRRSWSDRVSARTRNRSPPHRSILPSSDAAQ